MSHIYEILSHTYEILTRMYKLVSCTYRIIKKFCHLHFRASVHLDEIWNKNPKHYLFFVLSNYSDGIWFFCFLQTTPVKKVCSPCIYVLHSDHQLSVSQSVVRETGVDVYSIVFFNITCVKEETVYFTDGLSSIRLLSSVWTYQSWYIEGLYYVSQNPELPTGLLHPNIW